MATISLTVGEAKQWLEDALADGWVETDRGWENYYILEREGWAAHINTNSVALRGRERITVGSVTVWGPDELQILVPVHYNWQWMQDALKICEECGHVGETVRLGFAGRVCPECRKKLVDKVEYPGWCN